MSKHGHAIETTMLLMLDFDGVLHPLYAVDDYAFAEDAFGGEALPRFAHVGALAEALAPHVALRIVISSSWQLAHPLPELKRLIAPLGEQVIATTGDAGLTRYDSIRRWLAASGYDGEWIALDDDARGWPEDERHRLVWCDPDTGLDADTLDELCRRLDVLARGTDLGRRP